MARNPIVFSNGTLVSNAKVNVGGTIYDVEPAQYEGTTPLSASNLNQLQTNLYDYVDSKVIDEYSESTTDGYSANYVNEKVSDLESVGKTITFNNEWRNAFKPPAGNLTTVIPINNPTRTAPTINITAEIYSYGWKTCTCSISYYTETEICIRLTAPSDVSLTDGNVYLARLSGSITTN